MHELPDTHAQSYIHLYISMRGFETLFTPPEASQICLYMVRLSTGGKLGHLNFLLSQALFPSILSSVTAAGSHAHK